MLDDDIAKVRVHVEVTIGTPDQWTKWPGGWRCDIEAALIDAIFSARPVYRSRAGSARLSQWAIAIAASGHAHRCQHRHDHTRVLLVAGNQDMRSRRLLRGKGASK